MTPGDVFETTHLSAIYDSIRLEDDRWYYGITTDERLAKGSTLVLICVEHPDSRPRTDYGEYVLSFVVSADHVGWINFDTKATNSET